MSVRPLGRGIGRAPRFPLDGGQARADQPTAAAASAEVAGEG
jgi:hypothetical protein